MVNVEVVPQGNFGRAEDERWSFSRNPAMMSIVSPPSPEFGIHLAISRLLFHGTVFLVEIEDADQLLQELSAFWHELRPAATVGPFGVDKQPMT